MATILAVVLLAADGPTAPHDRANLPHPKGYVCYQAATPVTVDGSLDDRAWHVAPWTDEFVDIEGDAKPHPRFRTRAKMLWDATYFYVGAELEEPHVSATLTRHDSVIFHDNDFEVFIDPDGDNHEYYELEINALNTEWDLFLKRPYRDGGPAVDAWEVPGLKKGVAIAGTLNDQKDTDQGWSVELAIPWAVLGEFAHRPAPPRDGDQWRVNFSRVEWRYTIAAGKYQKPPGTKEDNWVWSPQGVIDMHQPEQWGYVQFSTAPPGSTSFRPDPTRPAREILRRIYHAQKEYQRKNGRWAPSFEALGLERAANATAPSIRLTPDGYEVSVGAAVEKGGPIRTLKMRQDSRIFVEPETR